MIKYKTRESMFLKKIRNAFLRSFIRLTNRISVKVMAWDWLS